MLIDSFREALRALLSVLRWLLFWASLVVSTPAAIVYGMRRVQAPGDPVAWGLTGTQWAGGAALCYAAVVLVIVARRLDEDMRKRGQ